MAVHAGLILNGDDDDNTITVKLEHEDNGDISLYNVLYGGDGDDTLWGNPGTDEATIAEYGVALFGEGGDDFLNGTGGDDTLSGGEGDDGIFVEGGFDIVDGGEGFDTLATAHNYVLSSENLTITGIERLYIGGAVRVDDFDLTQFETIASGSGDLLEFLRKAEIHGSQLAGHTDWYIIGSPDDDIFDLAGISGRVTLIGGDGDDTITGSKGRSNLDGEAGNDKLVGGDKTDVLTGGEGDDIVFGGGSKDLFTETKGSNTLHGGAGGDQIFVDGGRNTIFGGDGKDRFDLNKGTHDVNAGNDDDAIYVTSKRIDASHWHLDGGEGVDTLYAQGNFAGMRAEGIENLKLFGSKATTIMDADALDSFTHLEFDDQLKIVFSSGGEFTWEADEKEHRRTISLTGSNQIDRIDLQASVSAWKIDAGKGDDIITSSFRDDVIDGGKGDDMLYITAGSDRLSGGEGHDTFVFVDGLGKDIIRDFQTSGKHSDVIDLSRVSKIDDFEDLMQHHVVHQGSALIIKVGNSSLSLTGLHAEDLHQELFIF